MYDTKKVHFLNVRLSDKEFNILETIMETFSQNQSDAIRTALRSARVFSSVTIREAFKPEMLELLLKSKEFREKVLLIDALKTIPQLEKEIGFK